ncbi:hypothetical protein BDP55DRAFT_635788 [Colletotrichum godetiae]|uniref:Uncharacterized protein n=1 Tax=Colletotrichum godetiae TaxID=1209918 RepID=A0AAJ0ADY7_9PEZI|nr:uncharacterized protein BDP55DRAFT_635788 [Colletotrichum godetiae]KAK1671540.1 hypothetical protein BDP55DRAFT_635788 [Colletotrichum godetiae]
MAATCCEEPEDSGRKKSGRQSSPGRTMRFGARYLTQYPTVYRWEASRSFGLQIDSPDWLYLAVTEELAVRLGAFWGPSPGVLDAEAAWWGTLEAPPRGQCVATSYSAQLLQSIFHGSLVHLVASRITSQEKLAGKNQGQEHGQGQQGLGVPEARTRYGALRTCPGLDFGAKLSLVRPALHKAPSSLPKLTLRDAVRSTADREADEMDALSVPSSTEYLRTSTYSTLCSCPIVRNTRPDGQGPRQPIDDNLLDLDGDDDQECLPAGVDPHLGLCNVEITVAGPMISREELGEVSSSQKLPATKPKSPGLWSPWRPWAGKEQGKGVSHWFAWPDWSENSLFAALTNVKFPRATADHRPGTEMASLGPV